ncbi:MAG: hypothetical protein WC807_17780 [Hyphomicrobium sp.]|jgi:hypothetical protein
MNNDLRGIARLDVAAVESLRTKVLLLATANAVMAALLGFLLWGTKAAVLAALGMLVLPWLPRAREELKHAWATTPLACLLREHSRDVSELAMHVLVRLSEFADWVKSRGAPLAAALANFRREIGGTAFFSVGRRLMREGVRFAKAHIASGVAALIILGTLAGTIVLGVDFAFYVALLFVPILICIVFLLIFDAPGA